MEHIIFATFAASHTFPSDVWASFYVFCTNSLFFCEAQLLYTNLETEKPLFITSTCDSANINLLYDTNI